MVKLHCFTQEYSFAVKECGLLDEEKERASCSARRKSFLPVRCQIWREQNKCANVGLVHLSGRVASARQVARKESPLKNGLTWGKSTGVPKTATFSLSFWPFYWKGRKGGNGSERSCPLLQSPLERYRKKGSVRGRDKDDCADLLGVTPTRRTLSVRASLTTTRTTSTSFCRQFFSINLMPSHTRSGCQSNGYC